MARRFPPGESRWPNWVLPHLAGAVALGVADVVFERGVWLLLAPSMPGTDMVVAFLRRLFPNSLCYIAVVAITAVGRYAQVTREREAAAARLSGLLTTARLQALQAQLRPHFLFNTLSMIAEEVHANPGNADRMIGRLSHLLRASLESSERQEITLAEELDILQSYLDIMALRLRGRADFDIDIASDCLDAAVPTLVLQPLVENAFRHGIERVARAGLLRIAARRDGEFLEVTISDDGAGFDPERVRDGVGLRVVRERLAALHPAQASVHLRPRVSGGTISVLRLPFRALPAWTGALHDDVLAIELVR
jgi:LytS/YehU family sensor histidine kinase